MHAHSLPIGRWRGHRRIVDRFLRDNRDGRLGGALKSQRPSRYSQHPAPSYLLKPLLLIYIRIPSPVTIPLFTGVQKINRDSREVLQHLSVPAIAPPPKAFEHVTSHTYGTER